MYFAHILFPLKTYYVIFKTEKKSRYAGSVSSLIIYISVSIYLFLLLHAKHCPSIWDVATNFSTQGQEGIKAILEKSVRVHYPVSPMCPALCSASVTKISEDPSQRKPQKAT